MAQVQGGLFSLSARGTIGKTLVFSTWKGIPYTRKHVTPANPKSTGQQSTRGTFIWCHEIFKQRASQLDETWKLFASGKPFTSWNAFTSKNLPLLRGKANTADMVFVEGAHGGIMPISMSVTPAAGQLTIATVNPAVPIDWTLVSMFAVAIKSEIPTGDTENPMKGGHDDATKDSVVLSGLTGGQLYQCGAWLKWTKPDGTTAYSQSLQATGTPA